MRPVPPDHSTAVIQRLLGYAVFVGAVLALLLVVFVAKFGFLASTSGLEQAEIARNVAAGASLTTGILRPLGVGLAGDDAYKVLFSGPLYPLVLSVPLRAFGAEGKVVALTSMVFIILTLIFVAIVSARVFGTRVAVGAVGLLALTVPYIDLGIAGDEVAFLALITTAIFGLLLLWRGADNKNSQWWPVSIGALLGLAWLTSYETIAVLPAVLVFWGVVDRKRFWSRSLWTVVPLILLIAPWIIYNVMLLDRPVVSPYTYMLLTGTTMYPDDIVLRQASVPEHPWVLAVRHPGMIYLKMTERVSSLYHRLPLLANPYVTALFFAGALIATARRRLSLIYWVVLVAVVLTGLTTALYSNRMALLLSFTPVITLLAVFAFTEIMSGVDRPVSVREVMSTSRLRIALGFWTGLAPGCRGTGRAISFGLVLLALVVSYPMADYLFVIPAAQPNPIPDATALLGREPYDIIMTDVPGAVAWYAGKRTLILPDAPGQLQVIEQAGVSPDAAYLRRRPGLQSDIFPGFEWVERRDLPGLLWERVDDARAADTGDGDG